MTLASLLWFAVVYLKFEVTPEPLRYFWWLVWSRLRAAAHAMHRRLVVQGPCIPLTLTPSPEITVLAAALGFRR